MSIARRYMTRTDFLPKEGLIYVDTCGIDWTCFKVTAEDAAKSLERIRGFRNVFRKRGGITTVPGVLEEIAYSVNHYKVMKEGMLSEKKAAKRDGHNVLFTLDNMHEAERFYKSWNGVYDLLKAGVKRHKDKVSVSPKDVMGFVYDGDFTLSMADKEVVYTALVAGNGHGILSADGPLLEKYKEGVNEFHLPRAFICDSKAGKTYLAMRWQR